MQLVCLLCNEAQSLQPLGQSKKMNKFLRDKLQLVTGLIFGNFFAMKWSKIAIQNKIDFNRSL